MIRISTSSAMMISVVEITMRDWPPARAFSTCSRLRRDAGEIVALQRRDGARRATEIDARPFRDALDFGVTQHTQHGLAIGRSGVNVLLHGGVERRLRCSMSGLRLQPWGGGSSHEQNCHE